MKLIKKWSYLYNSYDEWNVSLFMDGDKECPNWYFSVQNGNNPAFFEGYMNGNSAVEPSLAEVMLAFTYSVNRISHYMPLKAEERDSE